MPYCSFQMRTTLLYTRENEIFSAIDEKFLYLFAEERTVWSNSKL